MCVRVYVWMDTCMCQCAYERRSSMYMRLQAR